MMSAATTPPRRIRFAFMVSPYGQMTIIDAGERHSWLGGANQIDNRQLEIGNDFTLLPLRSNELFVGVAI
jgi:hypothetical protein